MLFQSTILHTLFVFIAENRYTDL